MNKTIAFAGKGGVGKTTLAALTILRLKSQQHSSLAPILAVDADPNACLDLALGVQAQSSVGALREDARKEAAKGMAAGMSKQMFLEMRIAESLVEGDDFDYIAMGRPEGPGCYCYANAVLKDVLGQLADNYPAVVVDNEAGLENLSRRLLGRCDLLVLVADPSRRGLDTLERIHKLAHDMELDFKRLALAVNRATKDEPPEHARELAARCNADLLLALPSDQNLAALAEDGRTLAELPSDSPIWQGVDRLIALL